MQSNFFQCGENLLGEIFLRRLAHGIDTRVDSPSGSSNFFVGCTGDALLEICKAWRDERRMSVGINESRENDFASAVYFVELFSVLFDPGITKSGFGRTNGCDFAADAEHGSVFDDSHFAEFETAARARIARRRAQGEKLANVEKQRRSAGRRTHDCCEKLYGSPNIYRIPSSRKNLVAFLGY